MDCRRTDWNVIGASFKSCSFYCDRYFHFSFLSRQLTILSLNEEVAVGLGQKTTQIKTILFIVIILLAGASVALVGNMVFIGLMVPHIVRAIVGTDYRFIIPMSAILGATFMLFADTLRSDH